MVRVVGVVGLVGVADVVGVMGVVDVVGVVGVNVHNNIELQLSHMGRVCHTIWRGVCPTRQVSINEGV